MATKAKTPRTVPFPQVRQMRAEKTGRDIAKVSKAIRASLRKHDLKSLEAAGYTGLTKIKKSPNDGVNWPPMPASFAKAIIETGKPPVK